MKAKELIENNSLANVEVTGGQTVVFTEIALTAINMAREEGANNLIDQASAKSVMKLKDIISQLANRINQPHVIEVYLRQVYAKGFVNGTKQSPWISVNERLPDNDDDLYFVLDTKLEPPACGVCDFDLSMHKWVGAGGIILYPTHWMPVPKINE